MTETLETHKTQSQVMPALSTMWASINTDSLSPLNDPRKSYMYPQLIPKETRDHAALGHTTARGKVADFLLNISNFKSIQ